MWLHNSYGVISFIFGLQFLKYATIFINLSNDIFGKYIADKIEQTKDMKV